MRCSETNHASLSVVQLARDVSQKKARADEYVSPIGNVGGDGRVGADGDYGEERPFLRDTLPPQLKTTRLVVGDALVDEADGTHHLQHTKTR